MVTKEAASDSGKPVCTPSEHPQTGVFQVCFLFKKIIVLGMLVSKTFAFIMLVTYLDTSAKSV